MWLHLAVGVLLPTLVSIYSWRPPRAEAPAAVPPAASRWARLGARCDRLAAACDQALSDLLPVGPGSFWLSRVLCIWYLLACAWWTSRISTGLV